MTNTLSQDIISRGQELADNLNSMGVDDADVDDGLKTLVGKVLDISGVSNSLTIEVPLNLIYSDEFNITGTLLDSNSSPITSATIKLKVGSTVVDTGTTNNNGVVSFTRTPVSMGNHSFQLVYEGDSSHRGCESSVVSRVIGKETSVLTVNYPTNNASYYSDVSITVSGTLLSDDAEAIAGKSIVVSESNTTLATLTTGNDGSFSGTVSGLSVGTHSLSIAFATDDYYTASSVSRTVIINSPSLSLVTDKSILSYADSESATLTATYVGANVSGKTVSFDVVSGGVVVENIGTATTDNNGQCSVSYLSKGAGDLYIRAQCGMILSETYELLDYWYEWDCLSDDGHWTWDSTTTHTYSNDGVNFRKTSGSGNTFNTCKIDLPSEFEAEITYMGGNLYTIEIICGGMGWTYDVANQRSWMYYRASPDSSQDQHNETVYGLISVGDVLKFVRQNGVLKIYHNDVEKWSYNAPTPLFNKIVFQTYPDARNTTLKDLKIKPL